METKTADQAAILSEKTFGGRSRSDRIAVAAEAAAQPLRVISVTSGKGGVGKTNVAANLAIIMARRGLRVLVLDGDLGLANMDVLLGLRPRYTIENVLLGERSLAEVIIEGPAGIKVLPASSGVERLTHLSETEKMKLLEEFENYHEPIDVLLIDTGAGISANNMYLAAASQQIIVVTTPEPTSITDVYALMKVLSTQYGETRFFLLPNNVSQESTARKIYHDLTSVASKFLSISIDLLGYIPTDSRLPKSVRNRRAVVEMYPDSPSSQAFERLADRLLGMRPPAGPKGNIQFMWRRILHAV